MLERDDDDDVFEEAEAAAFDAREEARAAASQGNTAPEDDLLRPEAPLTLEDFNLLPQVLNLLDAHQAGDGYEAALSALRRALSRCEQGVACWAADAVAPADCAACLADEQAARAAVVTRTRLLAHHTKRAREWLPEDEATMASDGRPERTELRGALTDM
mmetsp:Transcript_24996/g.50727  ORF Transcript_24996/g.50727 Transcript_24996/m.50727 type:complete len:160 (-) Transcript_24996:44-523(-)